MAGPFLIESLNQEIEIQPDKRPEMTIKILMESKPSMYSGLFFSDVIFIVVFKKMVTAGDTTTAGKHSGSCPFRHSFPGNLKP